MRFKTTQSQSALLKGFLTKTCLFTFIILCNYNVFSQTRTTPGVPQTFNITTPSALTSVYSTNLIPGDVVILADGTYSSSATIKINGVGTEALPIIYKPATPGGVTFTGGQTMDIGGEWCIIDGFRWKGGNGTSNFIEFRDSFNYANNSTLKNCVVDGVTVSGGINPLNGASVKHNWVILYGTKNTVINCSFLNKITSGNMILAEYQFNATTDGTTAGPNTRCDEVGHKILNNYFFNYSKIDDTATNSGDSEAIRIGESNYQNVQSNALVQNNYFVQTDGENEIITNKSKGNSFINNTFRRCRGSLVLRHGSNTIVNGNYFLGENVEGTGGIRINDSYQTIRNNYIQDCINVLSQAKWNNGITFQGGNDTNDVICTSTSMTSGYQKVQNINVSNNTIVNTNAPLFYNIDKGSTDPTGTVSNNLIYFAPSNQNLTEVISGETTSSYADLGTVLTYSGNQYKGTTLGVTNAGFGENTGITAIASGEVFTFTGTDKGADMGAYSPTTDAMVGKGIGACYVNHLGNSITDGVCNVVIPESLIIGSLTPFTNVAGSTDVSVTANVNWTAASNNTWLTIDTASGTGDATVSVTVTENIGVERMGTVTFTQTSGTSNIVRTLNVTQAAPPPPDPRDGKFLINFLGNTNPVEVAYVSNEEIFPNATSPKDNQAIHSLDKNPDTQWASNGSLDPKGNGYSEIIYDLKGAFDLELVDIATTSGKNYLLQIWVSSVDPTVSAKTGKSTATYPDDSDFILAYPTSGFFTCSTTPTEKLPFEILTNLGLGTRYVKIVGNGQASPSTSKFTTIHEIDFYSKDSSLSVDQKQVNSQVKMYPNPVNDILKLRDIKTPIKSLEIYTVDGRKVIEKSIKSLESEININVSSLTNGAYILNIINSDASRQSKMFIVSH